KFHADNSVSVLAKARGCHHTDVAHSKNTDVHERRRRVIAACTADVIASTILSRVASRNTRSRARAPIAASLSRFVTAKHIRSENALTVKSFASSAVSLSINSSVSGYFSGVLTTVRPWAIASRIPRPPSEKER